MTRAITRPGRTAERVADQRQFVGRRVAHRRTAACVDGPVGRVGLELEAHCFDLARSAPPAGLGRDHRRDRQLWARCRAAAPSPWSPVAPSNCPARLRDGVAAAIDAMVARPGGACGRRSPTPGWGWFCWAQTRCGRRSGSTRAPAIAPWSSSSPPATPERAGAAMMTSTASIQVNLDAGPRAGWADRVRLAHALGPTMIAIAANSPMLAGEFTGWVSTRQRVWGQMDSARCGPILGASGDDPCTDWARYALKAPVMMVHTPDAVPVTDAWCPFADWADGLVLLGDRRPTIADLDYHLTTLFPPVRPRRGWRSATSTACPTRSGPRWCSPLVTLLDDPAAADLAAEAVEPVATAWDLRRPGRPGRPAALRGGQPVCGRGRRAGARGTCPSRCSGWCRTSSTADVPPTTSPTASSSTASRRAVLRAGAGGSCDRTGDSGPRPRRGRAQRTLRLVDFDDAELHRAVRPADEPAGVGPRAHRPAGRAVAAARRQPASARHAAARRSKASTTRSCTPGPAGSICRCCPRRSRGPTAARCAPPRSTLLDRLPDG